MTSAKITARIEGFSSRLVEGKRRGMGGCKDPSIAFLRLQDVSRIELSLPGSLPLFVLGSILYFTLLLLHTIQQ